MVVISDFSTLSVSVKLIWESGLGEHFYQFVGENVGFLF